MEKTLLTCADIGLESKEKVCDTRTLDMTDFYCEAYREILEYRYPIRAQRENQKELDVSILDLFYFPLTDDASILKSINERLMIDMSTPQGLKEINALFVKAKDFYERRYLKPIPKSFQKMTFKSAQDVIDFMKSTKSSKYHGHMFCALAKIVYVLSDVLHGLKTHHREKLDEKFLTLHLERPLQIEESHKDQFGNLYRKGRFSPVNHKPIHFTLISRQKSFDSMAGKEIVDAKYFSVEELKDLIGVTFYVETQSDAVLLMQFIDQMVYKGEASISNKNALKLSCVKLSGLNAEFRNKLLRVFDPNNTQAPLSEDEIEYNERKKCSAENYTEVKLTGNVDLPIEDSFRSSQYSFGTETKFVIGGHDNELGISLQSVYDYIKRFRELTRLGIMITKRDILNYTNHFFENIDEYLTKKNKQKSEYFYELAEDLLYLKHINESKDVYIGTQTSENNLGINQKALAKGLYNYFESKLVELKIKGSKKTFYADERILELQEVDMFRQDVIKISE